MGIGAYTAALLTMNYDASFPVALAGGMLAPAVVAAIIGLPTCACRASTWPWRPWALAKWCA